MLRIWLKQISRHVRCKEQQQNKRKKQRKTGLLITLNERKDRYSVAGLLSRLIFVAAIDAIFVALKLHHARCETLAAGNFSKLALNLTQFERAIFTLPTCAQKLLHGSLRKKKLCGNVPLLNR